MGQNRSNEERVFAPLGLALEYATPPIAKEDWLSYVNGNREVHNDVRITRNSRVNEVPSEGWDGVDGNDSQLPLEHPGFYGEDIRQYFTPI
jgi:hypothetical protein